MPSVPPPFQLYYEVDYVKALERLSPLDQRRIVRAEKLLAQNPRHPSLNTHKYKGAKGKYAEAGGGDLFIAYASQGKGALRIIFEYGPQPGQIALHVCGPHDRAERK